MTDHTRAIEAGARAIAPHIPDEAGGRWNTGHGENFPAEYSAVEQKTIRAIAKACITAAIASGALVPASAGQRPPLDWGKLVQCILRVIDHPHKGENSTEQAERIATAIIGRFDTAWASGDYVVVPRVPTEAMIEAGANKARDNDHKMQNAPGYNGECRDIWTAMLNAANRNGERIEVKMTEVPQNDWGMYEHLTRLADIVEVKAGRMTLESAQKRARKRQRESGMTPTQAHRAMLEASRRCRAALTEEGGTTRSGTER